MALKQDLPNSSSTNSNYTAEANYLKTLFDTKPRTSTGDLTYTSTTSAIVYATSGSAYANQGQEGLMHVISDALKTYLLSASDFNQIGDLTLLNTTTKTDLVSATNEVNTNLSSHQADLAPHGATVAAAANKLALRDANGNVVSNLPITGQNPNLLFNPSFNLGSAGWFGIGSNSFITTFGSYGEGNYLYNSASNVSLIQVDNSLRRITATAGATFTLSGEILANGVTAGGIGIQWYAYTAAGVAISGGVLNAVNGQGWKKYSLTFTAPVNTAFIQIACFMNVNTINTSAGWRKIKVEEGSVATTFSDDSTVDTSQYANALINALLGATGIKKTDHNTLDDGAGNMTVVGDLTAVNRTFVHAYINASSTTMATNTSVKIVFDTKVTDTLTEFDSVLSRFTAQKTGVYQINTSVSLIPSGLGQNNLLVYKNGVRFMTLNMVQQTGSAQPSITPGSIAVQLNAGDYIEIYANLETGGSYGGKLGNWDSFVSITRTR